MPIILISSQSVHQSKHQTITHVAMPTATEVGVPDGITQPIVRDVILIGVVMMDAKAMIVIPVTVPTRFAVTITGSKDYECGSSGE